MGVEGLSKHREEPVAIVSLGMVPGVEIVEDGAWKILWGVWQRTTKNEYHAGWVKSMIPTNTRPELTPEEDRQALADMLIRKTRYVRRYRSHQRKILGKNIPMRWIKPGWRVEKSGKSEMIEKEKSYEKEQL